MRLNEIEAIEVELFVSALRQRHGYDFSGYARASLKRRIQALAIELDCATIADLIPRVLRDEDILPRLLNGLSVPVSEMFRDPEVFLALRRQVVPLLHSYSQINIWQAGCANGEEVYSLAILLEEEGLYDRVHIYATDINDTALARAEDGIFPMKDMAAHADNFARAGGKRPLADYFNIGYDFAAVDARLRRNIYFAHHNLAADGVFCEVQLILCRNVLIYFTRALQDRVLRLFHDSLARGGILCLGKKENIQFSDMADRFAPLAGPQKIFQRLSSPADAAPLFR